MLRDLDTEELRSCRTSRSYQARGHNETTNVEKAGSGKKWTSPHKFWNATIPHTSMVPNKYLPTTEDHDSSCANVEDASGGAKGENVLRPMSDMLRVKLGALR